jgi:hypothetical protein
MQWRVSIQSSLVPFRVGATRVTQRPVAAGLGAVCDPGTLLMGQRHPLHSAEEARTALMAAFAPARTITQAVVVIHPLSRKTGRARVTGIAAHAGAVNQLRLVRDVIGRRGQARSTLDVAGGAGARGYAGVIKHSIGECRETCVAGVARGCGGDMPRRFAKGIPRCVRPAVTSRSRALPGQDALCGGMRECRGRECARVVAGIARVDGRRDVVGRLGHAGASLDVTGGATTRGHADMIKPGAGEGRITRRVARVARGRGDDMPRRLAECIRRCVSPAVTSGTRALPGQDALRDGVRER